MREYILLLSLTASMPVVQASTAYGSLGNFDTVNDTGQTCHGFEIEIDDAHSRDIGGTYDFNHYGVPTITEDLTTPVHPKVFIRYEAKNPGGTTTGFTNPAAPPGMPNAIAPTQGHQCTNPGINLGCEHFGVGVYNTAYTAVKYNWLIKDGSGNTVLGPAVNVGTPIWTNFVPAVVIPNPNPALPPIVQIPAKVVAVMPAPPVPQAAREFGEPSWVKVIKTTTHNNNHLKLEQLVNDDNIKLGVPDWANGEPAEVETEWYLMQTDTKKSSAKSELTGGADSMGAGDESVTRRYEFYVYAAGPGAIDGESGEAACDTVAPDGVHGVGTVSVTDANGNTLPFDCAAASVVGAYRGAQMGEFNGVSPLDLIGSIQNINIYDGFPQRRLPNGGNTPYVTTISGRLPTGLALDSTTGVLSGTPKAVGIFNSR